MVRKLKDEGPVLDVSDGELVMYFRTSSFFSLHLSLSKPLDLLPLLDLRERREASVETITISPPILSNFLILIKPLPSLHAYHPPSTLWKNSPYPSHQSSFPTNEKMERQAFGVFDLIYPSSWYGEGRGV